MNQFYDTFKDYSKEQLFEITLNSDNYQHEAINVAKQIIDKNNWINDLNILLQEKKVKESLEKIKLDNELLEKAAYYKKALEFKKEKNSVELRISDIPKFEAILEENGIDFFRENKNIGVQLDVYPIQIYFFLDKDIERVDEITKELGLSIMPYLDIKPFFTLELKVILIAVVLILLFLAFYKFSN